MTEKRADHSGNGGPRPAEREDDGRRDRSGHKFERREGEGEKVAEYARAGLTARQIGLILRGVAEPLGKDTILRHFKEEMEWGKAHMVAKAAAKLVEAVEAGKESSVKFYLQTQGEPGQFVERRELTGPRGAPLQGLDLATLADEDLSIEDLKALERVASLYARRTERLHTGEAAPVPPAP
jgi:hypothetical protein